MIGDAWLAWAVALLTVEAVAVWRGRARVDPAPSPALPTGRVVVLRPCAGADPWLERALLSAADAAPGGAVRHRVAVASKADPAAPVAAAACEALRRRGLDAELVVTAARGPNRKASQLARALAKEADAEIVVVADADVALDAAALSALLAPLARGATAAWAAPVEAGRVLASGDRASSAVLAGSLHAFPLLAALDPSTFVGKLFAVRAEALAAVGGFEALAGYLGEDLELRRRLGRAGHRVAHAEVRARSLAEGRTVGEVVRRLARWITVLRAQRPWLLPSYPAILGGTLPLLLAAPLVAGARLDARVAAACAAVAARIVVAFAAARASGRRASLQAAVVDAIVADLVLAVAFVAALVTRRVTWRGIDLVIGPGGRLDEAPRGSGARGPASPRRPREGVSRADPRRPRPLRRGTPRSDRAPARRRAPGLAPTPPRSGRP